MFLSEGHSLQKSYTAFGYTLLLSVVAVLLSANFGRLNGCPRSHNVHSPLHTIPQSTSVNPAGSPLTSAFNRPPKFTDTERDVCDVLYRSRLNTAVV